MIYNCFVGFIQICKGFFDEKVVSLSTKEYNSAVRSNIRQMINSNLLFWTSFILFENSVKAFRSIKHSILIVLFHVYLPIIDTLIHEDLWHIGTFYQEF